jgi:membrane dipeptidase
MVDVSHISDRAFWEVMAVSAAPVIASHSAARYFVPGFERDISDDMVRALATRGGVVQVNFGSTFVSNTAHAWATAFDDALKQFQSESGSARDSPEVAAFSKTYREENPFPYASVGDVLDHIDHIVALVGVDSVGIGSDFDGVGDTLPIGLKDVSMYPNLIEGLLERGYDEGQIRKILGENLLRVWGAVQDVAVSRGGHIRCARR